MNIRPATTADEDGIWRVLEPIIREGATYPLPRTMQRLDALHYWLAGDHEVFVADAGAAISGTYFLRANQQGGGSHVANCGYATALRGRGVGRALCEHSLRHAKNRGFTAMQFNFVVSTNEVAVHLWQAFGFTVVGRLPGAFEHPVHGLVDALVMFRSL
jgi:ribosomal protein S18 acetylase RimI-like enzyme